MAGLISKVQKEFVRNVNINGHQALHTCIEGAFGCEADSLSKDEKHLGHYLSAKYRTISLDFLKWRNDDGNPTFAVFNIDQPTCEIGVQFTSNINGIDNDDNMFLVFSPIQGKEHTYNYRTREEYIRYSNYNISCTNKIKDLFIPFFNDIFAAKIKHFRESISRWDKIFHKGYDIEYSNLICSKFLGLIPEETRQDIRSAKDDFDRIYIIGEANEWVTTEKFEILQPRDLDPLVIGVKDGFPFLITAFDLTSTEQLVKGEFTE